MSLIDGTDEQLREYDEQLSEVSADLVLKYMKVLIEEQKKAQRRSRDAGAR